MTEYKVNHLKKFDRKLNYLSDTNYKNTFRKIFLNI